MEEEKNYGTVFGTIPLLNEEHLDLILSAMDKEHALYYLVESVKCAYGKGVFTIGETEIISKSIRVLLKNEK